VSGENGEEREKNLKIVGKNPQEKKETDLHLGKKKEGKLLEREYRPSQEGNGLEKLGEENRNLTKPKKKSLEVH